MEIGNRLGQDPGGRDAREETPSTDEEGAFGTWPDIHQALDELLLIAFADLKRFDTHGSMVWV